MWRIPPEPILADGHWPASYCLLRNLCGEEGIFGCFVAQQPGNLIPAHSAFPPLYPQLCIPLAAMNDLAQPAAIRQTIAGAERISQSAHSPNAFAKTSGPCCHILFGGTVLESRYWQ